MATPSTEKNEGIETQTERKGGRPFGAGPSVQSEATTSRTQELDDMERDRASDRRQDAASMRRKSLSLLGSAKSMFSSVDQQAREHPARTALLFVACGAAAAFALRRQAAPSRSERLYDALVNFSESAGKSTAQAARRASEGASHLGRNLSDAGQHGIDTAKQSPLASTAVAAVATALVAALMTKSSSNQRDYEECSYDELYDIAKARGIAGRSKMNRDELVAALQGH